MKPQAANRYGVKANCAYCGAVSYFDYKSLEGRELGHHVEAERHEFRNKPYPYFHWRLLRCSNCGGGAMALFHDGRQSEEPALDRILPRGRALANLPKGVPEGARKEYREAEMCASAGAMRAASALVRSTLEKTLKANGYTSGSLQAKIDAAAADGVITEARKTKAHSDIRVLGNEVVHDEWRAIDEEEVESALHYAQRVLEDLYDDRASVEAILTAKGRQFTPVA